MSRRDPTAELRRVDELRAAVEAARRAQQRRVVLARYASRCDVCGNTIEPGAPIAWRPNASATHVGCFVGEVKS